MNITATLLVQLAAFALLIFFVNRVLWKPLSKIMSDRQKRIEDGLLAAEQGQEEKKAAEAKIRQTLEESKAQALDITNKAQQQANQIIYEAKEQAELEAKKIKTQAEQELAQQVSHAKNELRAQVSGLVMQGVKSVLGKEVDEKAHQSMLTKLSQSL